jgi:hypothetical protein
VSAGSYEIISARSFKEDLSFLISWIIRNAIAGREGSVATPFKRESKESIFIALILLEKNHYVHWSQIRPPFYAADSSPDSA